MHLSKNKNVLFAGETFSSEVGGRRKAMLRATNKICQRAGEDGSLSDEVFEGNWYMVWNWGKGMDGTLLSGN